jgi:hypothetical protein
MEIKNYEVTSSLLRIYMQNGFASNYGSYGALGIEISNYGQVITSIWMISIEKQKFQSFLYTPYANLLE